MDLPTGSFEQDVKDFPVGSNVTFIGRWDNYINAWDNYINAHGNAIVTGITKVAREEDGVVITYGLLAVTHKDGFTNVHPLHPSCRHEVKLVILNYLSEIDEIIAYLEKQNLTKP